MRFSPKSLQLGLLCLILLSGVSCSKDSDLFNEMIFQDSVYDDELESRNSSASEEEEAESTSNANSDSEPEHDNNYLPAFSESSKAFPTAQGFGKFATGGRGGVVVEVTNLNDSGPGSLREALSLPYKRTIVFKVGGVLESNSYLSIPPDAGNVTIAGQTAPGEGITIKGAELRIQASNVIVRYLKIRPGDALIGSNYDALRIVAFNGNTVRDIMIDHCSITWGADENVSIGGVGEGSAVKNVTIQNSIIGENIGTGYGLLLWNRVTNVSIYRNLFIHNKERNIRSSTCSSNFEMVNNIIYGYRSATSPTYENQFDVVGNVYKTNPSIETRLETVRLEASKNNCPDGTISKTEAYIFDNMLDNAEISISPNLNSYLSNQKIFDSGLEIIPCKNVIENVIPDVGANIFRSSIDNRIIQDLSRGTGKLASSANLLGGYAGIVNHDSGYTDTDMDGIADDWEREYALNPTDPSDATEDWNNDGYTNLEDYLYNLRK